MTLIELFCFTAVVVFSIFVGSLAATFFGDGDATFRAFGFVVGSCAPFGVISLLILFEERKDRSVVVDDQCVCGRNLEADAAKMEVKLADASEIHWICTCGRTFLDIPVVGLQEVPRELVKGELG